MTRPRLLTIAGVLIGLSLIPRPVSAQTLTCSPSEVRPSLVRIERRSPRAPGSGVVIVRRANYAIVLTAKHVLADPDDFAVYFQVSPDRRVTVRWSDATVFGWPADGELAVLRVDATFPETMFTVSPFAGDLSDGGALVSWGYPAARRAGTLCSYEAKLQRTAGGLLIADRFVEAGVSGGPMFYRDPEDRTYKLAGIVVRGDGDQDNGTAHAIHIRQAATIVATSPDPANDRKPHVWPNIVLPQEIVVDARLRSFIKVGGGKFTMGSDRDDEKWPDAAGGRSGRKELTLSPFYMGRFEVTVGQYSECLNARACTLSGQSVASQTNDHPVAGVSWYEASVYAEWLQGRLASSPDTPRVLRRLLDAGWQVDLPSEEEWEKAARRGGADAYPWGNGPNPSFANYNSGQLKVVGCTRKTASRPCGNARHASIMKTASATTIPAHASVHVHRVLTPSSAPDRVASVPHTIITSAMVTGASTGPHHGSGSRNRMSQSSSVRGHPEMRRRKA